MLTYTVGKSAISRLEYLLYSVNCETISYYSNSFSQWGAIFFWSKHNGFFIEFIILISMQEILSKHWTLSSLIKFNLIRF